MSTPEGQTEHPATTPASAAGGDDAPNAVDQVDGLIAAANRPGVDPCDVACGAMPAHVLGDLARPETDWLLDHTADCRYCANELHRFELVGDVLDRLHQDLGGAAPPAPPLPRRRRAIYARMESPAGPLFVAATEDGLCEIDFAEHETEAAFRQRLAGRGFDPRPASMEVDPAGDDCPVIGDVADQLREYFEGHRDRFDLPLDFTGVSPFTRTVLEATTEVPFGRLDTYRGIACKVGKPSATRAVGNALGRNPIPVVVPCHRIVRTDHSLGGYTGGSHIKQRLLALEGVTLA